MTSQPPPNTYKQGYSPATLSNHQRRTAAADASFLLPHLKPTNHILDIGCGPGTITTGFAAYTPQGTVTGLDISPDVLTVARTLAAEANIPTSGPGSVAFEQGNVLDRLPYEDGTFDVVFCSQVLGHMPSHELVVRALGEMRRVVKRGGIVAAREAAAQHFWPVECGLDRLWVGNLGRALRRGGDARDGGSGVGGSIGGSLPGLFRRAGFGGDGYGAESAGGTGGGRVVVGAGRQVIAGNDARGWIARRVMGQLRDGDPFRQSWVDAGITEEEIGETLRAVEKWAATEDAWFASLQCEIIAWK